jgi:hypothetical protein
LAKFNFAGAYGIDSLENLLAATLFNESGDSDTFIKKCIKN